MRRCQKPCEPKASGGAGGQQCVAGGVPLAAAVACLLAMAPASVRAHDPNKPAGHRVDRIVAIVDNDIITSFELEEKAASHLEALPQADGATSRRARREVLERVLKEEVSERLLAHEVNANKDRLGVGDKDIDRAMDEVVASNRITRDQLEAALYGQGMTIAEYRSKMREQIERARLMQFKVQGKVHVKDSDARRLCLQRERLGEADQQVCAGHLLLALPRTPTQAEHDGAVAQANKLRARLLKGESLAKLAQKYSDDAGSPDGSLGCFFRGEMVEAFEEAAFALQPGEVSRVVETPMGLHVIKVFERRSRQTHGCTADSELQPFREELMQQETGRQMQLWVDELRQRSFVEIRL